MNASGRIWKRGALIALLGTISVASAWAQQSGYSDRRGDLFQAYAVANRPSVPSDRWVGPDLFAPVPVFIDPQADMFRGVSIQDSSLPQDLFPTRFRRIEPITTLFRDPDTGQ